MLEILTKPNNSRREFLVNELQVAHKQVKTDSYLKQAREDLSNELFKEHVEWQTKKQVPHSDATKHFSESFVYLDKAISVNTSQEKHILTKKDERLGNGNKFAYFTSRAYLSLKRAFNEIHKEPIMNKQNRLKSIYTSIDEFISSKLLKFVKVTKLFDMVKRERQNAFEDYLYRNN